MGVQYFSIIIFIINSLLNFKVGELKVPLPIESKHSAFYSECVTTLDGKSYLWRFIKELNQFEVYNLEKSELQDIHKLKNSGPNKVDLFFAYKPISSKEVYIIDMLGAIYQYHLDEGIVSKGNVLDGIPEIHSLIVNSSNGIREILLTEEYIFLPIQPKNPEVYKQEKFHYYIRHNFNTSKNTLLDYRYPLSHNKNEIKDLNYTSVFDHCDELIVIPDNDNYLYKETSVENLEKWKTLKSTKEKNYRPWSVMYADQEIIHSFYYYARNLGLLKDKYRNLFYRIYWPGGVDEGSYPNNIVTFEHIRNGVYPFFHIEVFDENFNSIGNFKVDDFTYTSNQSFVGPKGLYLHKDHPRNDSTQEDILRYDIFDFSKLKSD